MIFPPFTHLTSRLGRIRVARVVETQVEEQESESEVDEDLRSSHEGKNISAWFGKKKADKPERNRIAESCIVLCIAL
jgi:hypothetical protein